VRVDESTVKAYHNICPHRDIALADGCGAFGNSQIMCPFYDWRWNLLGENQFVLERQEFCNGQLQASDVALRQVKVAVAFHVPATHTRSLRRPVRKSSVASASRRSSRIRTFSMKTTPLATDVSSAARNADARPCQCA
jgi:nitrite reductase/ring-hydroxylating ferredoxin subunit